MTERILVINPNSSTHVTAAMDRALEPLRWAGGPAIACATLAEGPPGIETARHIADVVPPLCAMIAREDNRSSAYVIACFSDPGLHAARETTKHPVFGIGEAGLTSALNLGERVGVIAIRPASVVRQSRMARTLGIAERFAGSIALDIGVVELADAARVTGRMREIGRRLIAERGADVIVMGCAGMAQYREGLQHDLGVPVIDPTQAAVGLAITAVSVGYH
ncbi:MAG: aspartate/glutamate racemase family protein [Alphaproteobacteria bacterium]